MEISIVDWIESVAQTSTDFEKCNSDLKRRFLIHNIETFNQIASKISVSRGTFGTGYPFYALNPDLTGQLPIIKEQIRYNDELITHAKATTKSTWSCGTCLPENYDDMPDLKQVCKPCPNMDHELKPRKVINRLPDIDMWMVCVDGRVEQAQQQLTTLLAEKGMHTSDVDPIQSIEEMKEITEDLKNGRMPKKFLPVDVHIMEYSKMKRLIEQVPGVLERATVEDSHNPYLPIHPKSYRKSWQYDDEAYNFIYDFLSAFTAFNFEDSLNSSLVTSRSIVAQRYSEVELFEFLLKSATAGNARRFRAPELQLAFIKRMKYWQKHQELGENETIFE